MRGWVNQCWGRLKMAMGGGGKGRVVVVLTALVVLWMTVWWIKSATLTRLFFEDVCRNALAPEKSQSPWQPESDRKEEWWQKLCRLEHDMRQTQYYCRDSRWMGNRAVCFDFNLVPAHNCTVYSFGIDFNFKFDDAMADYGCTVYSFDPSMNVSDHQRSDRVYFKGLGLAAKDTDGFVPRLDGYVHTVTTWRMRRLSSIMKELGHSQGSLTVLKIDIESMEWDVVEDLLSEEDLLASIPQVLIEWHLFIDAPVRSRYDKLADVYFSYKSRGFHSFYWSSEGEDHSDLDSLFTQTETSWVNERFLVSRDP